MEEHHGLYDLDKPFFRFLSGRNITVKKINKVLAKIFPPTKHIKILGHSFRYGLISSAANFPDIVNDPLIKEWGRWKSNSFLQYELLDCEQKRWILNKLTQKLDGDNY
jgi:hypothetical protein